MPFNHVLPKRKEFHDFFPVFVGYEKCCSGHSFGPAIRDFIIIHYIKNGKGTFSSNGKDYTVSKGEAFIIFPGEVTRYEADKYNPWEYYWFSFGGTLTEKFLTLPSPIITVSEDIFILPVNMAIKNELTVEFAISKLYLLYGELFSDTEKFEQSAVKKTAAYINLNYMEDLSVERLSEVVNLDRRYLSRLFKSEMGISVMPYIISKRCEKAKAFLKSGYSVRQTASMVGYGDPYTFSKMFKKETGISPSNFKSKV